MTILDFSKSKTDCFDYDTVQRVWGGDVDISVVFDNKELGKSLDKEEINLRGIVRLLSAKLKFVEDNRSAVNAAVLSADIEGFAEGDLKTLYISWMLFTSFVDTGTCELYVYLASETDVLDGAEIAVTVHNDNTITFDDIV